MAVEPSADSPPHDRVGPRSVRLPIRTKRSRGWRALIPGWRAARRVAQLAFLILFLVLIRATEFSGADILPAPVNLFFRMDPLAAVAAMLSSHLFLATFWPALIVVLFTLFFGRFFCGWICPLGTLLDYFHRLLRPIARQTNRVTPKSVARWRPARYWLLVVIVLASLLRMPIVGYFDPFGLLVRGWAVFVDPMLFHAVNLAGDHIDTAPLWSQDSLNNGLQYLRDHALPFRENIYSLFALTTAIFAALFALELVARRFWCRYLCPLGALLGLAGRWSLLRRLPVQECKKCSAALACGQRCRMDAFDESNGKLIAESCNLCMDCTAQCPTSVARFKIKKPATPSTPIGLSRRGLLTAITVGVAVPALTKTTGLSTFRPAKLPQKFVRPPGAVATRTDENFLNLCIRCGECLKVCTTNGLQPAALEAGWAGLFAPVLVPRQGYCEYACTLCGQVCPTGAIPLLSQQTKAKTVMGKAAFDRSRCLPWAKNEECLCCEEHCPTGEKAIQFDVVTVIVQGQPTPLQRPYVVQDRCIGCGICENKCPLDGPAAIQVYRTDAVPTAISASSSALPPTLIHSTCINFLIT